MKTVGVIILIVTLLLFGDSFKLFFTHDDFFLLKIAQVNSVSEYLNFFNISAGPEGLGMYRPLTTQVFYNLAWTVFKLNPFGLHVISYLFFLLLVYLVYKFSLLLLNNAKLSLLSAFLYAISASHFAHLFYLATFQEIGLSITFLLSILTFKNNRVVSIIFFVLSLMSKETAVVLPIALLLVNIYLDRKINIPALIKYTKQILPYIVILLAYLYARFFHYGFAQGDSYIWDFSPRIVNTLLWYLLWSLNLPEMLVDYIGPGLNVNNNLFLFWRKEMVPIIVAFTIQLVGLLGLVLIYLKRPSKNKLGIIAFCFVWFIITLVPVIFLPLHKFTFYLTLPLIGITVLISELLKGASKYVILIVCISYLATSYFTIDLTKKTNWITSGSKTAERVNEYFKGNINILRDKDLIVFIDNENDNDLPWKPTSVLKVTLSDLNYFSVFHPDIKNVKYGNEFRTDKSYNIEGRQFLGY